jgi:hypothetical protein
MEGISAAASIIGVIQLTGSIVKICGGYLQEVKNARQDIITLQRSVTGLEKTVQKLRDSLEDPDGLKLAFSQSLFDSITNCLSDLGYLKKTIDPGEGKGFMRRFGIRSLKWPIKYTELDKFIQNLERHKSTFALALQIDQRSVLLFKSLTYSIV